MKELRIHNIIIKYKGNKWTFEEVKLKEAVFKVIKALDLIFSLASIASAIKIDKIIAYILAMIISVLAFMITYIQHNKMLGSGYRMYRLMKILNETSQATLYKEKGIEEIWFATTRIRKGESVREHMSLERLFKDLKCKYTLKFDTFLEDEDKVTVEIDITNKEMASIQVHKVPERVKG